MYNNKIVIILIFIAINIMGCSNTSTSINNEKNVKQNVENINIIHDDFESLSIEKKVILATSLVDKGAINGCAAIIYNIEGNVLFVSVQSDIEYIRGNPIYKILIGPDVITPIDGVKDIGSPGYEYASVNTMPIDKSSLYKQYIEDKEFFDYMENIAKKDIDNTTERYKIMKEEIEYKYQVTGKQREYDTSYESLPLTKKIQLLASVVDYRANERNFIIYYSIEEDILFINVHSGAGVGHPIYKFKINPDFVTPIDGVVNNGFDYELLEVNTLSITKKELYDKYNGDRYYHEFSENLVENNSNIKEEYDFIKNKLE